MSDHRRKSQWKKPKRFDRNLIVIGGGAAGLVTAYIASAVKAKVTLVEANQMGGDCLNYGCVPSKTLIKSAKIAHQIHSAEHYGFEPLSPTLSFKKLMARIQEVIHTIEPHDSIERYTNLGVEVLVGRAKIIDPWNVEIDQGNGHPLTLSTCSIVLATGSQPVIPTIDGLEEIGYLTTDTLWDEFSKREQIPNRLLILGGGPIGCELAQSFARLGAQVTQIELAPRVLLREDEAVSAFAQSILERDGVKVLTDHRAVRCMINEDNKFLLVEHQGVQQTLEFDDLICAVGRSPQLTGLGLETLGIDTDHTLETNEYLATLYPNIFAAGDIVGQYQFTHTAAHQAWYAAINALFGQFKKFKVNYRVIPRVTFLDPEIAAVGLNETEAKKLGIDYEVTTYSMSELDRAITEGATEGMIKVLTVPGKDRILGVTLICEGAGDLLAEFTLAMKQGMGLNTLLSTVHPYPTWSEANKYVAGEWRRQHSPAWLLKWLERFHRWRRGKNRG